MIVPDVDAATSRQISMKNELDLALYRYAVARFLERSCAASLSQPGIVSDEGRKVNEHFGARVLP